MGSVKAVDENSIRIGMAKAKTSKLVNIWKDRSTPTVSKVILVRGFIWSVLMYGCERWVMKKEEEKRIDAVEMTVFLRNSNNIKERKLTFLGHQL